MNNPNVIGPDVKNSVLNKGLLSKVLSSVTEEKGFHFYLAIVEPTGETAVSLAEISLKKWSLCLCSRLIFTIPEGTLKCGYARGYRRR